MSRTIPATLILLLVCGLAPGAALAGDAAPAAPAAPEIASDEEAAEALKEFKVNWKAKGLRGDDKVMQRDFALKQISPIQHPDIVTAIGKATRSGDSDMRLLALMYLADQKAFPHKAATHVLKAMKKHKKDTVLVMTGLQTLGALKYLGASKEIEALLKHNDYVIRKSAIAAVGNICDIRLLAKVLKLLGIKAEPDSGDAEEQGGSKEVVEEGYSWEGVDVTYDTGTAGDGDQKMAEKIGKEKLAANKAAAEQAAAKNNTSSGAGGDSGSGGGMGRGGQARSPEELIPAILRTLKKLTGEEFDNPKTVKLWLRVNRKAVKRKKADLDKEEKAQKKA